MIAKLNPTGTHVHKSFLKVRIDLYPEVGDKTYPIHYVDHFDREPTEEELREGNEWMLDLIPKHKELNPCLCHFITIDPDSSLGGLTQYVKGIFDKATLKQLDDLLSEPKTDLVRLGQVMRPKFGVGKKTSQPVDIAKLNSRLSSLEVKV